jgi:hypothetical protein
MAHIVHCQLHPVRRRIRLQARRLQRKWILGKLRMLGKSPDASSTWRQGCIENVLSRAVRSLVVAKAAPLERSQLLASGYIMIKAALLSLLALAALPSQASATQVVKVIASPAYKKSVAVLDKEHERIVADIVTLTEIPAPPLKEKERATAYLAMLKAAGLTDVEMDEEGNVMGIRRGTGAPGGPLVAIAAHLDTVFPEGTPIKVRREGTRLLAPGIGDDSRSLAVLLGYVRAMNAAGVRTKRDILFIGNVGEEGPGDLRGVRYLFTKGRYKDRIKSFFSMDGTDAAGSSMAESDRSATG